MHELTAEELVVFTKAERRRVASEQFRLRVAANEGAIKFIDNLLSGLDSTTPRYRSKMEPWLLSRKARTLIILGGIRPLVDFFAFTQRQLLDPIMEAKD